jgi:hypothetical protein
VEVLMFVIDRADARRLRRESDPKQWHSVFIWVPRFVLTSPTGSAPRWTFVGFREVLRRSLATETIGDRIIHRWVYRTDVSFAL